MEIRDFPNIVVIMRIKNEERWLKLVFDSVSKICSGIIVLDGNSTDSTVSICEEHEKVIKILHQKDPTFNETRDKNDLLNEAMKHNPDFILTLDGDQMFPPNCSEILLEEINVLYPNSPMFSFQELFIFDTPNQYRYDGVYCDIWTRKLIRISDQPKNLHFKETEYPSNAHCPSVPQMSVGWNNPIRSNVKILHYGNYDEQLRKNKFNFNTQLDPDNITFDGYKHIISTDTKYSGKKLELRTLPVGMFYPVL